MEHLLYSQAPGGSGPQWATEVDSHLDGEMCGEVAIDGYDVWT